MHFLMVLPEKLQQGGGGGGGSFAQPQAFSNSFSVFLRLIVAFVVAFLVIGRILLLLQVLLLLACVRFIYYSGAVSSCDNSCSYKVMGEEGAD